jgi:hypothetical protein
VFGIVSRKYIDNMISSLEEDPEFISSVRHFDPYTWLETKSGFDEMKK